MWANRFVPGILDWYLGRTGYRSQQTSEPEDPNRPANLWETVPGDQAAHGRFDDRATAVSPQLWATTHRAAVMAGAIGLVAVAGLALRTRR